MSEVAHTARRNRWLLVATQIMVLFALALTFAGSAPTGTLGVDMLTVSVASMTTLSVYLAPLLALMISFDAIAGDVPWGRIKPKWNRPPSTPPGNDIMLFPPSEVGVRESARG